MLCVYLLDVIAGYFLPGLYGWIFLVFVLISEGFILSKRLNVGRFEKKYYLSAGISNLVTTLIGYLVLDDDTKGGHLLTWIPIEEYQGKLLIEQTIFLFFASFLGSVLIEIISNRLILGKSNTGGAISRATLLANIFTYTVAAIIFVMIALFKT